MKFVVLALLIASALVAAKPQAEEQSASDIEKQLIDTVKELLQNPALSDLIYEDEELAEWAKEILDERRGERLILLGVKAKIALKFLYKLSILNSLFTTTTTTAATVAGRRRR